MHLREAARLHTGVGFAGRNGRGAFCLHIRQVLLDALHQLGGAFARLDAVRQRGGDLVARRFVDAAHTFQALLAQVVRQAGGAHGCDAEVLLDGLRAGVERFLPHGIQLPKKCLVLLIPVDQLIQRVHGRCSDGCHVERQALAAADPLPEVLAGVLPAALHGGGDLRQLRREEAIYRLTRRAFLR